MHNTSSEPLDLDPVFDPTSLHRSSGDCDNDNNNVAENPASHASSSAEVEVDPLVFKKSSNESSSLRRSRTTRTTHNSNHMDDDEATQEDTEDHYYTKEDLLRYQQKRKLRQQKRSLSNRKLREKIGTSPSAASSSKKNKASATGETTTSSEHTKEDSRTRKSRQQQRQSASYSPPPPSKKRSNSKEKSSSSRQARPRNKRTDSASKLLRKNASRSRTNSSRSLNANNKKSTRSKSRQKTRENSSRRLSVDELFAEEGGKGSKSESKPKAKAYDSTAMSPPKSPKSPSTHKKGKASILSMSSPPSPSQRKKEKRRSKSAGRTKQLQEVESLTGVALLDVNGSTIQVKAVKRTKSRGRASHKTSKSLDDAAFSDLVQAQGEEKSKNNKREMKREKSSSRMSSSSNNNKENKRASLSKSPSSIKTPPPSDPPSSPSSHSKKSLRQSLHNDSNSSSTKEPRKRSNLKRSGSLRVTQRERYESKEEQPTTTTATASRNNAPSPNKINVSKSRRRASLNGPSDGNNTASMVPNKSGASRRQSLDVGASGMQQPLLQRSKSWSTGDEDEHERHHKRPSLFRSTSQRVTAKEHKDQTLRARHGRRAAFKRYKSQLNVSGAKPKESGSSNNLESSKKKKKSQRSSGHKKGQKTSLLDLISTPNKPDMLERKSSMRFATAKGVGIDDAVTSSPKKAVRFATNDSGERVWCLVKTVPKQPSSARSIVWWTEQELDERQEKDLHILSLVQDKYRPTLSRTFESARKPLAKLETVELAGESLSACALARGLEHQVLFPEWPDHRKKHIKAVLAAQNLIQCQQDAQQNSMFLFNDSELKLLRLQSLKLSRTSQLVALKLAELDQALANEEDGDNSESESGS